MPSISLHRWQTLRALELDEIQNAHIAVGGSGRGRRYATQQLNHAYLVLLSSQFQGFCRDLHSEAVDFLVGCITPPALQPVLRSRFVEGRKIDSGNPNPGNLGSDFGRLGMAFWPEVHKVDRRNVGRQKNLEQLNAWRNAIAHQDFDPSKLGGRSTLVLKVVRIWRSRCDALARSFDQAVGLHLSALAGAAPW